MKKRRKFSSILLCAVLGLSVLGLGAGVLKMGAAESLWGGSNPYNYSDSTGGGLFLNKIA